MIKLLGDLGKSLVHLLLAGGVAFIKMCLDALAFQIAHHRVPACLVDAGDNHLIPGLAQYLGRFAADAAGGSGNQCCFHT
jgi:hypothetical protein